MLFLSRERVEGGSTVTAGRTCASGIRAIQQNSGGLGMTVSRNTSGSSPGISSMRNIGDGRASGQLRTLPMVILRVLVGRSRLRRCVWLHKGHVVSNVSQYLIVAAALSVLGTIIAGIIPRWSEATERRRTRYAEAIELLVAWAEFPYRIARRVDNHPETLKELGVLGHTLQERLAFHGAWVSSESPRMGRLYNDVVRELKTHVGQALTDVWEGSPASSPQSMNIGDLGINQDRVVELIMRVSSLSRTRFGYRRLLELFRSKKRYTLKSYI